MDIRLGHGYDVHAFEEAVEVAGLEQDGSPLKECFVVLGGVEIAHHRKLLAHSDGDVVIHALCDALLGSLALGDIGSHFPDTDEQYKNACSRDLLMHVVGLTVSQGYSVSNIDITVVAQRPRLAEAIPAMRETLAADCLLAVDRVSVKATTTEGLGFVGKEQGIACYASVLMIKA